MPTDITVSREHLRLVLNLARWLLVRSDQDQQSITAGRALDKFAQLYNLPLPAAKFCRPHDLEKLA